LEFFVYEKDRSDMQIILCRHGETEWSSSGKHTSFTNIPLTKNGELQARELHQKLRSVSYDLVYTSPLLRARTTCELAHLSKPFVIEPNAVEWNYGDYEGLTTPEIWSKNPKWNLFSDGAPNGESPNQVGARADHLIQKWSSNGENIILFSHAHFIRVLAARWIGLSPSDARLFGLSVGSTSILGFERTQRIIQSWNH
jgi:probable phosphoglycerate mutase